MVNENNEGNLKGGVALVRISELSQVRMFLVVTSQNSFYRLLSQVRIVFGLLSQVRIVFIDCCHKSD